MAHFTGEAGAALVFLILVRTQHPRANPLQLLTAFGSTLQSSVECSTDT